MELEIGQVLWLNVRYQTNIVSKKPHPMLVAIINIEDNNIEAIGDFYEIYIITRVGSDGTEKSLGKIQILIK